MEQGFVRGRFDEERRAVHFQEAAPTSVTR
jgi:hypothetical protein